MLLATRVHTVGNRRRYIIDYSQWLDEGLSVSGFTAVSTSSDAPVDTVSVAGNKGIFFLNGGVLNETFTVNVQMIDSKSEIKNDTLTFNVVAP